jgi:hypothetical protein
MVYRPHHRMRLRSNWEPRVTPESTVEHVPAIARLGLEALELIVAHDLEAEPDHEEDDSQAVDSGEARGTCSAHRDEEWQRDEP